MLTLIHGDDIIASRRALTELKEKHLSSEKIILDGAKVSLTDIISATDSLSFFAEKKLVMIENLFSGTLTKEKEAILEFLKESKSSAEIILWEQKEIGKSILKKYFTEAKIISCQLPQMLFKFLDSFGEKPIATILSMLHNLTTKSEAEFILSMLIRQWRYLIIASDLGQKGFTDMPSWQAYKFLGQAKYFNLDTLISSYRQLLSIDMKIKTGLTPLNANQLLDIFFVSLYYENVHK